MPPWETRATPKRPLESKSVTDSVASDTATPSTVSKKRKVDWATIDDKELFHGFTLHAPKIRATKRSGSADKKQKTRKSIVGGPAVGGSDVFNRDAPLDAEIVQKNPFAESSLSETHYLVKPAAEWESTLRYRKFTISEAEFEVGQTIFVSKTPEEQDADSAIQHWIGRVLEVRAGDAAHVYLRVYWLYRPEDLPGGRQPYHAESELIASNHMDIIEALSVMDKASVMHWDEDMDKPWPGKEQLFWRQTFDVGRRKGQQLSSLRTVCVDKAPCNPDEGLIQCPSCSEWLHAHCLEERAVEDAQTENGISIKKTKGARKSSAVVEITARFTTLGETGPTYLTVKDVRPEHDNKRWNVDIKCLMCNELIEKAAEELPLEAAPAANNIDLLSREAAEAKEVEVDLATGKEEEEEEKVAAPLAEPARRGRGRPRESEPTISVEAPVEVARKPKRERGRQRKVQPRSPVKAPVDSAKTKGQRQPRKRKRSSSPVEALVPVVKQPASVAAQTPVSAPVNESVFQSGLRLVKRLIWRSNAT